MMLMKGYEKSVFSTDTIDGKPFAHDVYTKGDGPVILLIQELPGIGAATLRLADKLVASGFRVVMPHLFGPLGKISIVGNATRVFCMRREFSLFSKHQTSPVVRWLSALGAAIKDQYNVSGIGVIGMCLTGNFAISMMADAAVLAAVASQPSLPLLSQKALHMSTDDTHHIRTALDEKGAMLAFRFAGDTLCGAAKFSALDATFNDDRERIKLTAIPGKGHSVLTIDFVDKEGAPTDLALREVIAYFGEKLRKST